MAKKCCVICDDKEGGRFIIVGHMGGNLPLGNTTLAEAIKYYLKSKYGGSPDSTLSRIGDGPVDVSAYLHDGQPYFCAEHQSGHQPGS